MKLVAAIFLFILSACGPGSGSSPVAEAQIPESQFVLPYDFVGPLNFKELKIGVKDQIGGCQPTGCTLGGIGKDTMVTYNSKLCYFNTSLVKNYRTNYYFLEITPRVEDIPNYNYQPNPTECNELLGQYWIHHNGQDNENLLIGNKQFPHPFNMEIQKITQ